MGQKTHLLAHTKEIARREENKKERKKEKKKTQDFGAFIQFDYRPRKK